MEILQANIQIVERWYCLFQTENQYCLRNLNYKQNRRGLNKLLTSIRRITSMILRFQ